MNILQKLSIHKFSAKYKTIYFFCAVLSLIFLFLLSLFIGAADINISDIFLKNHSTASFRIFFYIRLPRSCSTVLAGSALAAAGVIIQAVLNNAMASPNIIGVNSGAGLFTVLVMVFFPNSFNLLPFSAFLGAFTACMFIYILAKTTGASRMSITLTGIAVSSILNSGISLIKTLFPNVLYNMSSFSVGGLSGVSLDMLKIPAVLICLSLVTAVIFSKDLDILILGELTASSLGMNTEKTRFLFLTLASILAGSAVSFAGLIGFVGLVVPHIVRIFTGSRHRLLVPLSAIFGADLVLICDMLSRTLFKPYELPVGIILSIIGGIFFIFLILTQRKSKLQ